MHLDDYYQTYKLLLPYLVFLDQALGNPPQSNTH